MARCARACAAMGCNCFGFVDDADLSVHLARPDASRLETLSDVPDPLGTTRGDCQARLPGSATSRESKSCICVLKETSRRARRPGRRTTCVRAMVWTPAHASSSLMREANAKIQDEIRELEQASGAAVPALRTQRVRDEVLASMGLALAQVQAAGFRWDAASHLFVTGDAPIASYWWLAPRAVLLVGSCGVPCSCGHRRPASAHVHWGSYDWGT